MVFADVVDNTISTVISYNNIPLILIIITIISKSTKYAGTSNQCSLSDMMNTLSIHSPVSQPDGRQPRSIKIQSSNRMGCGGCWWEYTHRPPLSTAVVNISLLHLHRNCRCSQIPHYLIPSHLPAWSGSLAPLHDNN
jgi:hypothetical protein